MSNRFAEDEKKQFRQRAGKSIVAIGSRKEFPIQSSHKILIWLNVGEIEGDDIMSDLTLQFNVQWDFVVEANGHATYKLTAPEIPMLDRAVNHLEEADLLADAD